MGRLPGLLEPVRVVTIFAVMRDSVAPDPDRPRKDLHGRPRPRMTLAQLQKYTEMVERYRRGGRRDGEAGEGIPVDPRKPNTLSGGAAAALDFD